MQLRLTNSILIIRNQIRFGQCCFDFEIPECIIEKVGTNAAYNEDETDCDEDFELTINMINNLE